MASDTSSISDRTGNRKLKDISQEPVGVKPYVQAVAEYLENIITLITEATNAHDADAHNALLEGYFAPDLQVAMNDPQLRVVRSSSREAYAQQVMAHLASKPHFQVECYNTTVQVDEKKGRAQVFTMQRVRGAHKENLELTVESSLLFEFEREKESWDWSCVRVDIMRGSGGLEIA